ncbi:MAG: glycerol-3-phosphate acyltransferase [Acidimicrobiia bacterium]
MSDARGDRRQLWPLAAAAGAGYLLGTIPSADIAAARATGGAIDLRVHGSGNPGAFNAMGTLGKRWGYAVAVADVAKGSAGALVGRSLAGSLGAHVGGTAAVVGHCYPVWSGFRGGKGVASAIGQFLATHPAAFPVEVVVGGVGALSPIRRSLAISVALGTGWVACSVVWWRRRWPNLWGPPPTVALPVAATTSTAIVLQRFLRQRRA